MKKNSTLVLVVGIVIISVTAILFSWVKMYNNSKTDGFGGGSIRVDQCKADDAAWKIYTCSGFYMGSAGLVEVKGATVKVTGRQYETGEYIYDVYPTTSMDVSPQDTRSFITGRERSSVLHNTPWLAMLFFGALLLFGPVLYMIGRAAAIPRVR